MIVAAIVGGLTLVVSWLMLYVSVKKNLEMMDNLESAEERTAAALEILDTQYANIERQLKIEVFSDEPVVKQLVQDIKTARDSVLLVSRVLNGDEDEDDVGEV